MRVHRWSLFVMVSLIACGCTIERTVTYCDCGCDKQNRSAAAATEAPGGSTNSSGAPSLPGAAPYRILIGLDGGLAEIANYPNGGHVRQNSDGGKDQVFMLMQALSFPAGAPLYAVPAEKFDLGMRGDKPKDDPAFPKLFLDGAAVDPQLQKFAFIIKPGDDINIDIAFYGFSEGHLGLGKKLADVVHEFTSVYQQVADKALRLGLTELAKEEGIPIDLGSILPSNVHAVDENTILTHAFDDYLNKSDEKDHLVGTFHVEATWNSADQIPSITYTFGSSCSMFREVRSAKPEGGAVDAMWHLRMTGNDAIYEPCVRVKAVRAYL